MSFPGRHNRQRRLAGLRNNDLRIRQAADTVCGYIGGDANLPTTCQPGSHFVLAAQHNVIGCCSNGGDPCTASERIPTNPYHVHGVEVAVLATAADGEEETAALTTKPTTRRSVSSTQRFWLSRVDRASYRPKAKETASMARPKWTAMSTAVARGA